MSYVDLTKNDVWSESDITNRGRALIESQVSEARQNELRTIMLGHIAQMRVASPEELGEIMQVAALTEQAAVDNAQARADMALLNEVMAYEAALAQPALPSMKHDATPVTDENGVTTYVRSPEATQEMTERLAAGLLIARTQRMPEVLALYSLRNPVVESLDEVVTKEIS